jgi:epothilone synthetase B
MTMPALTTVTELIASLSERGIELSADGDHLRVRAPKGVITTELRDELARHKDELLRRLATRVEVESALPLITPRPDERYAPFPLNDIQQAYWVGRTGAVELGNVSTHAYLEFDARDVDIDRMTRALRLVIARQDMLRAIVLPSGEQQILRDVPPYEIAVVDVSREPPEVAEATLLRIRDEMSHQLLALDQWPLFDVRATRLKDRVRTHLSIDLMITDFGSLIVFINEWGHFYDRPDEPLPPLEISFRDFVLTERDIQRTELYKRSERYWLGRLQHLPPRPQLPLAVAPASIEHPRFTRRGFVLDADRWQRLKERAREEGLTPSGLLLAAFAEVLGFWSESRRFTINLTQYNRLPLHRQVNQIIGNSISVVLLAIDNDGGGTFAQRARSVQQQLWQDLDHTLMSGVRVLQQLARKQVQGPNAIMPVVFTSILGLEALGRGAKSSGIGELRYVVSQTPQVWLDHQVQEIDATLVTSWDAVDGLFPEGVLDDMLAAYRSLLERLVEHETWHAVETQQLPERHAAVRKATNANEAPLPEGLLQSGLADHARLTPDALAVIAPGGALTYRELFEQSNRLARWLRNAGATPNQPVAIIMEKGCHQMVAVMGVLAAGAPYMPIDPTLPAQRLKLLLEQGGVQIVLTESALAASLQWPGDVRRLTVDACDLSRYAAEPLEPAQSQSELAYVLFTSGSTGVPKGAMLDHRGPLNTVSFFNRRFDVGPNDRALALSALNFDLSVYDIFGMFAAGGAVVMPDPERLKDPAHWCDLMAEHNVTIWNSVPTLMRMMVEYLSSEPDSVPPGLRLVVMSGDWIPVSLPDRIRALWTDVEVVGAGGPTETSVWNVYYPIGRVDPSWTSIPYGRPTPNNRYHVMDGRLRHRPEWVAGELVAEGVGLGLGYWRDSDATAAKFAVHPQSGARLYKTGDVGRYRPDGQIDILGRLDFQVKIDGRRIELGEIEAALRDHPDVRDVAVGAVGEERDRKRLVAYVVARVPVAAAAPVAPDAALLAHALERADFKLSQPGVRRHEPQQTIVELPQQPFTESRAATYEARRTVRRFRTAPVPLERFSRFLDCLQQFSRDDWPLPKYRYPSAGSLYPVQIYLHVKQGRVEGLDEGTYYYEPTAHRLFQLEKGARIAGSVHVETNRALFAQSAFSLLLVAKMDAIVPMYGAELASQFCLLEAGYIGQTLMLSGAEHGIGICPIGAIDFEAVRASLHLDADQQFVHSMVGGLEAVDGEGSADERRSGSDLEQELRRFLRERLPDYMVPSAFVFLDALPLNANNKLDRTALPDPMLAARSALPVEIVPPQTEIERALAAVVSGILGVATVGIHSTFFELGGTSVDLVRIHAKIKEQLGREIGIVDLFRRPTIALLAEYLNDGDGDQSLARIDEEAARRREGRQRRRQRRMSHPSDEES